MISGQTLSNRILYNREGYTVTEQNKEQLGQLYDILNQLRPCGDDERHVIWFSLSRGSIDEYEDFDELKREGLVTTYSDYISLWKRDFPDSEMWFRLSTVRYKEYISIYLNGKIFIEVNPNEEKSWPLDLSEYIELFTEKAIDTVKKVKAGTYNTWLAENLPLKYRYGTIPTKRHWEFHPDQAEEEKKNISRETLTQFKELIDKYGKFDFKNPPIEGLYQNLTVQKYLELAAIGYRAVFPEEAGNKTVEEMYRRWADNRDGGLLKLPLDDPEAFLNWYNLEDKWQIENPSHLWEVIQGSSRTRMHFRPYYTSSGWYFLVSGSTYVCPEETVKFYVALANAGICIRMIDVDKAYELLSGSGLTGIVPCYLNAYDFLYGDFPVKGVLRFAEATEEPEEVLKEVTWLPENPVYLAEKE